MTVIGQEPSQPGDSRRRSSSPAPCRGVTSVPFSLRAVVPPRNYSFTGTVTGWQRARGLAVGSPSCTTSTFPRGQHSLGVGIQLGDPNDLVYAHADVAERADLLVQQQRQRRRERRLCRASRTTWTTRHRALGTSSLQFTNPVSGDFTSSPFQVTVGTTRFRPPRRACRPARRRGWRRRDSDDPGHDHQLVGQGSDVLRRSASRPGRHALAGRTQRPQHVPAAAAGRRVPVLVRADRTCPRSR